MWRNDVKDFMTKVSHKIVYKEIELVFSIKDSNETLKIKLNRPDLIYGITYILVPLNKKDLQEKVAIHPLTKDEIRIIVEDINEAKVGIPAHIEEDYIYAVKNNLPIKQVIMPVNASLDENKPREDKEWIHRENIVLIVKHWSKNKYMYIEYKHQDWKCFISGGVEEGESFKNAAIRELKEESGYTDIKSIEELPFKMANVFYAAHKGVNRYSPVTAFYIELASTARVIMSEEEQNEHSVKWASKEELYEILKNGFTDQIWLLKQYFNEINAYTGQGKYINSDIINNLENQATATTEICKYLEEL
ncbi:MAG: NUDIX domain-containing protein [Bacilli bacterium]|nr:NUDIX domain-containing protein [Bacilli bacterium]